MKKELIGMDEKNVEEMIKRMDKWYENDGMEECNERNRYKDFMEEEMTMYKERDCPYCGQEMVLHKGRNYERMRCPDCGYSDEVEWSDEE